MGQVLTHQWAGGSQRRRSLLPQGAAAFLLTQLGQRGLDVVLREEEVLPAVTNALTAPAEVWGGDRGAEGPCSHPNTGRDGARRARVWRCCPQAQLQPAPRSLTAAAPPAAGCRALRWAHFPPAEAARPGTSPPFSLLLIPCWRRVRPRGWQGRGSESRGAAGQPLNAPSPPAGGRGRGAGLCCLRAVERAVARRGCGASRGGRTRGRNPGGTARLEPPLPSR